MSVLSACGPKESSAAKAASSEDAPAGVAASTEARPDGPAFDVDKGLYLPEATRQSMGITTASAEKKLFRASREMKFQVFREGDEKPLPGMSYRSGYAYASAILTDPPAGIEIGQLSATGHSRTPAVARFFQRNTLPNSAQTELLVEISDPQHQRVLGEFCSVRWQSSPVDSPVTVPDSALLKTTEGNFVYAAKADRLVRTEVKLGASGEGSTQITEGIAAGDLVVTNPVQDLWLTELKLKSGGSEP